MARKLRADCIRAGHPNHIIVRGNNRRRLFSYPHERLTFLRLLGRAISPHGCTIQALCLMDNHAHLMLTPPEVGAASACLKSLCQCYAQKRNGARNASGKLFEQRYFSEPILDPTQLALTTMYIEANPLRAGLTTTAAEFPWSTFALHTGVEPASNVFADLLTPSDWYLGLAADRAKRQRRYRALFQQYLDRGEQPVHADEVARIEKRAAPYSRRLRRPNGPRASEAFAGRLAVLLEKK